MITCLLAVSVLGGKSQAQDLLSNVYGRELPATEWEVGSHCRPL